MYFHKVFIHMPIMPLPTYVHQYNAMQMCHRNTFWWFLYNFKVRFFFLFFLLSGVAHHRLGLGAIGSEFRPRGRILCRPRRKKVVDEVHPLRPRRWKGQSVLRSSWTQCQVKHKQNEQELTSSNEDKGLFVHLPICCHSERSTRQKMLTKLLQQSKNAKKILRCIFSAQC